MFALLEQMQHWKQRPIQPGAWRTASKAGKSTAEIGRVLSGDVPLMDDTAIKIASCNSSN